MSLGKRKNDSPKSGETQHPPKSGEAKHEPTERRRSVLNKQRLRGAAGIPAPRPKTVPSEEALPDVLLDNPDIAVGAELAREALGTADPIFTEGLIEQITNLTFRGGTGSVRDTNFLLSIVKGIKPNDPLEAMLATQMAAVHSAIMTFAHRLANAENIPQQDSAERALNKLARTFAMQLEALKRYRTGGEQKVTVQHVTVGEGGQAIVGNVNQAARVAIPQKPPDNIRALVDARQAAMPVIETPERELVPVQRRQKDDGQSSS